MSSPPVVPDAILEPSETKPTALEGVPTSPAVGYVAVQSAAHPLPPSLSPKERDTAAHGAGEREGSALTPKSRSLALIAKCDEKIRRKATDIVLAALRAPETSELPEDALQNPPQGWTKRSLRVALDATNSMKAAPAYLGIAQRIVESFRKAEADKQSQPVINAELVTVTVNQQVNNYPVRVLEED